MAPVNITRAGSYVSDLPLPPIPMYVVQIGKGPQMSDPFGSAANMGE